MWIGLAVSMRLAAGGAADVPPPVSEVAISAPAAAADAAGGDGAGQDAAAAAEFKVLAPAPEGVTEILFRDFFKPVGELGLEFTQEMSALDGQRVRIVGYMVRRNSLVPGQFILTPYPVMTMESEAGFADDLPAMAVWVHVPGRRPLPWRAGLMAVTGVIELGNKEEPDGRVSAVRMALENIEAVGPDVPARR